MAWLAWGAAVALALDWWSDGRVGRSLERFISGLVAVAGGLVLGTVLGAWLPHPGGLLLGAGLLGYLGLFQLAEAGGVVLRRYQERDGLAPRALVEATGVALLGLTGTGTFACLVAGIGAGALVGLRRPAAGATRPRLRLAAGLLLCLLSLVTFRAAI